MSEEKASEGALPVHLQPGSDELLSSWLVRLAVAYGMSPDKFYSLLLPEHPEFPTYVDETNNLFLFERLAGATGVPEARVKDTTLIPYESAFSSYKSRGDAEVRTVRMRWIMPASHRRISYDLFGLQYCPRCLSTDKSSYFRRRWRIAFVTLCDVHRTILIDRCTRCNVPIDFRRNASEAQKKKRRAFTIMQCYSCNFDIREAPTRRPSCSTLPDEIVFQESLLKAAARKEITILKNEAHLSQTLFDKFYSLMELLAFGEFGKFIRTQLCRRYGLRTFNVTHPQKGGSIETLGVRERFGLMRVSGRAMEEWLDDLMYYHPHYKPDFSYPPFIVDSTK